MGEDQVGDHIKKSSECLQHRVCCMVVLLVLSSHAGLSSECWVSSATEYAEVSLLVCERLTLIIKMLTFLGDIRMFISALRHAVRDKPGKYHPAMLRRSTAATSVMRCELVSGGGGDAAGNDLQHLRFTVSEDLFWNTPQ